MIHPTVEQHFEALKVKFPQALIHPGPDGTATIEISGQKVAPVEGWNKHETSIYFQVPLGYPQAKPDCFWADPDLSLAAGNPPANTNIQVIPNLDRQGLWFSWHVTTWNPTHDDLTTYVQVIRRRIREAR